MKAGVIGVGTMGRQHARVYSELRDAELVGIHDQDQEAAQEVAAEYGTRTISFDELLETADAVSIAVPTAYHYEVARSCLEHKLNVLVEKPFAEDLDAGEELINLANSRGCTLQVGHIERFNPATQALDDILGDKEILAVDMNRLGPPRDRTIQDSAVLDLMIHDIDIVLSLLGRQPDNVSASGVRNNHFATATLTYDEGPVVSLTASRVTQRKVRTMDITLEDCLVTVDFIDKSVQIHRQSAPEYVEQNGDIKYRHEGIVEHPMIPNGEPLKHEIQSFLEAAKHGTQPEVTGWDGIEALKLAREIDERALNKQKHKNPPQ
ncbi:Gfo/Idh/MocA family protein [Halobacterium salinarum]|uniref:Gfo/Idh/MocA family protein n=1 Tax=Halobacterium salinarum TaxID=2242 RepID=UPI002556AF6E|nr:Gfo/Idh/MocA family oxidoreductase [Halobacterium salinarum]